MRGPLLLLAVSALACAEAPEPQAPPDASVLMEADRAFSADVQQGGSEAWVSWFAEGGSQIVEGLGEVRDSDTRRQLMAGLDQGVSLSWEPTRADIAASGDLGWTTGTFVSEAPGPDGETVRGEGWYVSIWRLQPDGTWKVVMDLGNPKERP